MEPVLILAIASIGGTFLYLAITFFRCQQIGDE